MLTRLIALALLLLSSTAQAESCPYPKKPINWIMRYCAMKSETDDEVVIQASPCFKEAVADAGSAQVCETNKKYKSLICDELIKQPTKYRSKNDCMHDEEIAPYISG